jgi:curli production assembly/transport component CsgG
MAIIPKKRFGSGFGMEYSRRMTNNLNLTLGASYLTLEGGRVYSKNFLEASINAEILILPFEKFTPYIYGGGGYLFDLDERFNQIRKIDPTPKIQAGVGMQYLISPRLGIKAFAEDNFTFSDDLDLVSMGKRDDFYYNFGIGINYYFGRKLSKEEHLLEPDAKPELETTNK